jgi:L-ribulose-5-phosphate 3-epimerase
MTEPPFRISLAQWSLHRMLGEGKLDHLDFAKFARDEFGLEAVEYVNSFFKDKAEDAGYLAEMARRCADHGVRSLLIMVDGEGALGAADRTERLKSVRNHHRWADAARALGCHSIRVNAQSSGSYEEQQKLAADGLSLLSEYCAALRLNVIVENHGGLSSNGKWLAGTIAMTGMENCGTLPDFGNFTVNHETGENYDRYEGVTELMPVAKAVSAKSYDFDEAGNETTIDFPRMMGIVHAAGYRGFVGIEYEGGRLNEVDGIKATRDLLARCFAAFPVNG